MEVTKSIRVTRNLVFPRRICSCAEHLSGSNYLVIDVSVIHTPSSNLDQLMKFWYLWHMGKYVLKRVSFGSKDCTKELKLECAYFLGQTS